MTAPAYENERCDDTGKEKMFIRLDLHYIHIRLLVY
jgi:hypothetical protein